MLYDSGYVARKVIDGKVTDEIMYLSAIDEAEHVIAQANVSLDKNNRAKVSILRDQIQSNVL